MKKNTFWMLVFWGFQFFLEFMAVFIESGFPVDTHSRTLFYIVVYPQAFYYLTVPVSLTLLIFWFIADAWESDYGVSYGVKQGALFFSGLAIPYYLIKYKGWKRSLISFAKFFGFIIAYFAYSYFLENYPELIFLSYFERS
ncbi:MAG: hypothetical protein ACU84J_14875 [Gammaproteobacteria bacterium]